MKIGLFKNKSFSDGSIATYWKVNVASINNEFNFVKVEVVGYKDKAQYTLNKRGYIKESRIERIWSGTDYEAFEAGMAATANLYDMVYTKLIESVMKPERQSDRTIIDVESNDLIDATFDEIVI